MGKSYIVQSKTLNSANNFFQNLRCFMHFLFLVVEFKVLWNILTSLQKKLKGITLAL